MTILLLVVAGLAGGAVNALAGGGMFLIFPALLLAGVASVKANATASLVVMPGTMASAWVYRRTLDGQNGRVIVRLVVASVAGAAAGSILLLSTPNGTFTNLVPWLLLIAAAVFSLAPQIRKFAARGAGRNSAIAILSGELVIAIYGGYFGAGMGVLMIALFLIASTMDLQTSNGVRLVCASAINVMAVILFAWRGALDWRLGLPMLAAGVAGGYIGARVVRRLNERAVRNAILVYAWGLTAYFFARQIL